MADLQVKIDDKEVKTFLKRLPETLFSDAKKVFQESAFEMENAVKDNATNKLKVRSGHLRRSISNEVFGTNLKTLGMSIFSAAKVGSQSVVYAPIHETGGTIRAKNAYKHVPGGPYLNVPAPANKTPAGVQRLSARDVFQKGGYVAGKTVRLDGKTMFFLIKQARIKPRLGMEEAVVDRIPTLMSNLKNLLLR